MVFHFQPLPAAPKSTRRFPSPGSGCSSSSLTSSPLPDSGSVSCRLNSNARRRLSSSCFLWQRESGERERGREKQTDSQTDRQTNRQTDRQRQRQRNRETQRRQSDRQTDREGAKEEEGDNYMYEECDWTSTLAYMYLSLSSSSACSFDILRANWSCMSSSSRRDGRDWSM